MLQKKEGDYAVEMVYDNDLPLVEVTVDEACAKA